MENMSFTIILKGMGALFEVERSEQGSDSRKAAGVYVQIQAPEKHPPDTGDHRCLIDERRWGQKRMDAGTEICGEQPLSG